METKTNKKKDLILFVGHQYDLAFFKRLLPVINSQKQYSVTCILLNSYFLNNLKLIEPIVNSIADFNYTIKPNSIPIYGRNIIKNLMRLILFYIRLVRKIDFDHAIFMTLDKSSLVSNILLSRFKKIILFQFVEQTSLDTYYTLDYAKTILGNFYSFFSGSKSVKIYKNLDSRNHCFHFLVNHSEAKKIYICNENSAPHVVLPKVVSRLKSKKVIIFGGRYTQWPFIKLEKNRAIILNAYKKIYDLFSSYEFIYKPHPLENGEEFVELNQVFEGRLINIGIDLNSELYLIENSDIEYCFSISSTSSRSAFEMGFSSKVIYRLLDLDKGVVSVLDNIYHEMPDDFFIKKIEDIDLKKCEIDEVVPRYCDVTEALEEFTGEK